MFSLFQPSSTTLVTNSTGPTQRSNSYVYFGDSCTYMRLMVGWHVDLERECNRDDTDKMTCPIDAERRRILLQSFSCTEFPASAPCAHHDKDEHQTTRRTPPRAHRRFGRARWVPLEPCSSPAELFYAVT